MVFPFGSLHLKRFQFHFFMPRISDLLYSNKIVFDKRYRTQDVSSLKCYANSRQGLQLSEDGLSFVRLIRPSKSWAQSVLPAFRLRSPTPYWSNLRLESRLKRFRLEFFIWWDLQWSTFALRSFNPDFFLCRGFGFNFFSERSLLKCFHLKKLLLHFFIRRESQILPSMHPLVEEVTTWSLCLSGSSTKHLRFKWFQP
jgi:hypothetical protein